MGQTPAKYFPPPAPYGSSMASNTVNPVSPGAQNPQTPLLPPNFLDPGKSAQGTAQNAQAPIAQQPNAQQPMGINRPNPRLPYAL